MSNQKWWLIKLESIILYESDPIHWDVEAIIDEIRQALVTGYGIVKSKELIEKDGEE